MSQKKRRLLIRILYDEWFKLLVGGIILAVLTVWINGTLDGGSDGGTPPKAGGDTLALSTNYRVEESKTYVVTDPTLQRDYLLSIIWRDGQLETKDAETGEEIVLKTDDVIVTVTPDGSGGSISSLRLGASAFAGRCKPDGIVVNLMEKPVPRQPMFVIRLSAQACD